MSIADAFRFKGALPEVANCRLAMLGESCWCGTASILHWCILSALLGCDLLRRRRLRGLLPLCLLTCSLALLFAAAGVVSALGYEIIAHKSLAVQIREAPLLIAATFLVIIVATLVRSLKWSDTSPVNVVSRLAPSVSQYAIWFSWLSVPMANCCLQVPILKGVPRRGSTEMGGPVPGLSSDAEIINGRYGN